MLAVKMISAATLAVGLHGQGQSANGTVDAHVAAAKAAAGQEHTGLFIASAERFQGIVERAGADALISNHTIYDGTKTKILALAQRKPGAPHPYVIGGDAVKRYLTVASECAHAAQAALP